MGKKSNHCRHCDHGLAIEAIPQAYLPPPETWVAWLMPVFVIANIAAFVYTMYLNDCPSSLKHSSAKSLRLHDDEPSCVFPSLGRYAFEPLSVNPLFGPKTQTLDRLGALSYERVVTVGQGWRLFSCIWLHAGIIHLVANMFSLLFIGVRLEQEFGFGKIGVLYLFSGFGGSLLSCLSTRTNISVGASGALLGAMLSELITNWALFANKCAALTTLLFVILINLAVGVVPHVDSASNVGGFCYGFLLGFLLLMRPQFGWVSQKHIPPGFSVEFVRPKYKAYQYLLWPIAFVLLIIGFMHGLLKLFATFIEEH